MTTLDEFVTARLDEDKAIAKRACDGPWRARLYNGDMQVVDFEDDLVATTPYDDNEHIARFDPVRVLAEVEAKRRIVELTDEINGLDWTVQQEFGWPEEGYVDAGDRVLRLLALPYADHPDFDPAWLD